jgi:hypothetical protein
MTFDIPHMIATAIIVWVVIWLLPRLGLFAEMTAGRQRLIQFAAVFVLILILNLVWPYGTGV